MDSERQQLSGGFSLHGKDADAGAGEISENEMINIISQGTSGNIVVMGTTAYDFDINVSISMPSEALVGKIMEPNGINIIF